MVVLEKQCALIAKISEQKKNGFRVVIKSNRLPRAGLIGNRFNTIFKVSLIGVRPESGVACPLKGGSALIRARMGI